MKTFGKTLAAVLLLSATTSGAATLLVCNGSAGCPDGFAPDGSTMFATVNAAATEAQDGDTILIWPGTYQEQVRIRGRSNLLIRGMDRYGVRFDGDVDGDGTYGGSNHTDAIKVGSKADPTVENITIENMYGTGYFGQPFFWENVKGYEGRYLSAVNNRRYGIYTLSANGDPANPSVLELSYNYGHGDGGFYIGECSPCNAVIRDSWSEWNALGYSGTNAGGNLVLERTIWNHNRIGILPNTLDGESHAPQRGITIRNNHVYDNNYPDFPRVSATAIAPDGIGIGIAGGMSNQIYGNTVHGNGRYGIAVFWLFTPPHHNMVFDNVLWNNGADFPEGADLADAGPGSVYNCFGDNVNRPDGVGPDTEPTTQPPALQELNSCESNLLDPFTVPIAQSPASAGLLALAAGQGQVEFESGNEGTTPPEENAATPQTPGLTPAQAAAVQCMPNPCAGIGDNLFCSSGAPVGLTPSAECS